VTTLNHSKRNHEAIFVGALLRERICGLKQNMKNYLAAWAIMIPKSRSGEGFVAAIFAVALLSKTLATMCVPFAALVTEIDQWR
jgi:hypothetical protein